MVPHAPGQEIQDRCCPIADEGFPLAGVCRQPFQYDCRVREGKMLQFEVAQRTRDAFHQSCQKPGAVEFKTWDADLLDWGHFGFCGNQHDVDFSVAVRGPAVDDCRVRRFRGVRESDQLQLAVVVWDSARYAYLLQQVKRLFDAVPLSFGNRWQRVVPLQVVQPQHLEDDFDLDDHRSEPSEWVE